MRFVFAFTLISLSLLTACSRVTFISSGEEVAKTPPVTPSATPPPISITSTPGFGVNSGAGVTTGAAARLHNSLGQPTGPTKQTSAHATVYSGVQAVTGE